jgi:hypothetical protein
VLRRFLAGVVALSAVGVASTAPAAGATDKFLLVSWDGINRRILNELLDWQPLSEPPRACPSKRRPAEMPSACGDRLTCLPTLCRFQLIDSWDSEGKPLTRPQHAQMLSGYSPQTNGIFRNNGSSRMPIGYTVYERIKAVRPDVKTLHVAGRKYVSRGVVKGADRVGALDYYARRGGPDERTGVNTTLRIAPMLEEVAAGPFLAFVHYKEADVTGHESGAETQTYREAIIALDHELQSLLDTLESVGALADTKVLVTTDHGFLGQFHVSRDLANTETWIATQNLPLRTDVPAKLLDVTPTILAVFGVDTTSMDPPLEGSSLLP